MCFSATASFTASAGLMVLGVVAMRQAHSPAHKLLASIPLLFSAQQGVEGLIWLSFSHENLVVWRHLLVQIYAIFIGMVWPILVPLSIYRLEPSQLPRRCMLAVLFLGVVIAVYTVSVIWRFGVRAEILHHSIFYQYAGEDQPGTLAIYFIATCGAFFCSSHRRILWIGLVNVLAFFVTYYFYTETHASVWCFFAAVLSGLICVHLRYERQIYAMLASH